MAKTRIYELAKEIGAESKDVLALAQKMGADAKTVSSGLDQETADGIRGHFTKKPEKKKEAPVKKDMEAEKVRQEAAAHRPVREKKPETADGEKAREKTADGTAAGQEKPKKKHVRFIVNHQNMSNGGGDGRARRREGDRRRNRDDRRQAAPRGIIRPKGLVSQRTLVSNEPQEEIKEQTPAAISGQEDATLREQTPREQVPREQTPREQAPREQTSRTERAPGADRKAKGEETRKREQTAAGERPARREPAKAASRGAGIKILGHIDLSKSGYGNNRGRGGDNRGSNRGRGGNDSGARRGNAGQGGRGSAAAMVQSPVAANGNGGRKNYGSGSAYGNRKRRDDRSRHAENMVSLEKTTTKRNRNKNKGPERNMEELLTIQLPEHLTIQSLAEKMMVTPSEVIKNLFMKGTMATINTEVDYEQAEKIAEEFNCICEPEEKEDVIEELLTDEDDDPESLVPRPPVVVVMGHVDHGKTSLLDKIRQSNVSGKEAGGITQAIGAYTVKAKDRKITFLDTPGHEAFTAMRMRGANSTDIAVLVVAADDGVMPQTVEAINHAKAAGVEIIVAINKIDKVGANVDRVKQELSEYELIPEDWGGSTVMVPVSAHTGEGIDTLLDMILLTADVLELKANPNRNARGVIIEAKLDRGRGVVATALVQKGTLHVGDYMAAGASFGRIRAMSDDHHKRVKQAGPSVPVEILGLSEVPNAGEIFNVLDSDKEARSYAQTFVEESKSKLLDETRARTKLGNVFDQIKAGSMKELDLIVKADVQGSVEAVTSALEKLSNDEVIVKVIHGGVGAISESDVVLASASNAIIIGFNVRPDTVAKNMAEDEGVDIQIYSVIYNAIEDVEGAMKGMLEPVYEEQVIGHAQVRQIFKASGVGNIAGSYVLDGQVERGCKVRIHRGKDMIWEGNLGSLKRFKDDVKEVKAGYECGLVFDGFADIQVDDEIEAYKMVEVPR